jgi:hypothetical protein
VCSGNGRRQKLHGSQEVDGRRVEDSTIKDVDRRMQRLSEKGGRRDYRERATATLQPQRGVDKGSFICETNLKIFNCYPSKPLISIMAPQAVGIFAILLTTLFKCEIPQIPVPITAAPLSLQAS